MSPSAMCIHGHFYQPPRVNPFTGKIPHEPDAAPFANWNVRVTSECYAPNAEAGNFGRISFNLGETLARWLDEQAHETYERIIAAERRYRQTHGVGNGLAQPVHHTILPLARRRDKICQVRWGVASFSHRFGHQPEGMWLPEMAVDYETLEILASEGIRFIILSDEQVQGDLGMDAGPYQVKVPSGRNITVFVRDRNLSNALSFGMPDLDDLSAWMQDQLEWRCRRAALVLIATDGETFGHHHRQGADILRVVAESQKSHGCSLATLGPYLRDHPPKAEIEVIENTSWSCSHGVARWIVGCSCTAGDSRWKAALRRALDNLACDLDGIYVREAHRVGARPWPLRDNYIAVILGQMDGPAFLAEHNLSHLDGGDTRRVLWLLQAQFHRQRMYTSCTFFFDRLDRPEPRYAITNAVRALALTRDATGQDLSGSFRRDLGMAVSTRTPRTTAADVFNEVLERAGQ